MSFFMGFGFVGLLFMFTIFLYMLYKRIPSEYIQSLIVLMFVGDGVLVGMWYYGLLDFIDNERIFRLGIGLAFCIGAFSRSLFFMLKSEK